MEQFLLVITIGANFFLCRSLVRITPYEKTIEDREQEKFLMKYRKKIF